MSRLPKGKDTIPRRDRLSPSPFLRHYDDFISMGISPRKNHAENSIYIFFFILKLPSQQIFHCPTLASSEANRSHSDINALILDYLTMEGYPNAAAKFSKEAKLQPHQDISSIQARQEIQTCIYGGNIQSAIETLNDLDPEVR